MAKISQIDKAILVLDGEIKVLELAKAKLQQQQGKQKDRSYVPKRNRQLTGEEMSKGSTP